MQDITIYHNPNCGTSRNTLALIRHVNGEPNIIYYLETPPSEAKLRELLQQMAMTPRQLLRTNVPPFAERGLENPDLSNDDIIQHMLAEPILINRPIVVSDKGVKLCRPSEVVLDLLDKPLNEPFVKEDGEVIPPNQP